MTNQFVRNDQYGINFIMRPEVCVEHAEKRHIYLAEDRKRSFIRDEKRHRNILIEGENYHALKILTYTHASKVDVIYIDPPYATGNKDFVYNDDFAEDVPDDDNGTERPCYVDGEDPYRHSKWLSFMYRRLQLARELLSERGVIFISIDDNEFAQLKLLCDSVFGEKNFIANLIWKNKFNGGYDAQFVTTEHEYILIYAKDMNVVHMNRIPFDVENDKAYKGEDEYISTRGRFKVMNLDDKSLKYSESLDFKITAPDGSDIEPENCWRWGKDKVQWGMKHGFLSIVKDKDAWRVNKKQYQYCDNDGNALVRAYPLRTIIDGVSNTTSGNEIKSLFGDKNMFQYAKPVELIKRLLYVGSQKDSIILDFFAGSGTTGQAVAELNKEDGGTRQFILVTNNDKSDKLPSGISRQVTFPRLAQTIGNENLSAFRIQKLKKASNSRFNNVGQLLDGNKLLPILKLQYNTFQVVEVGDEKDGSNYLILTDHNGSMFVGVWDGVMSGIGRYKKKFKTKLNGYSKNNETLSCEYSFEDDEDTYPCSYYDFMSK